MTTKVITIDNRTKGQFRAIVQEFEPSYQFVQLYDQHVRITKREMVIWVLVEGERLPGPKLMEMVEDYLAGRWQLAQWNLRELTVKLPNGTFVGVQNRG